MLSDTQIRTTKPGDKSIRLYDERGRYVEITPNGGRWWRLKYRFQGKEKLLSMGTYPDTGLKLAREKRERARALLADGVDPSQTRRAEKASRPEFAANSFEAVCGSKEQYRARAVGLISRCDAAKRTVNRSMARNRVAFR